MAWKRITETVARGQRRNWDGPWFTLQADTNVLAKLVSMLKGMLESISHTYINEWHNDPDIVLSNEAWQNIWSKGYNFSCSLDLQDVFF